MTSNRILSHSFDISELLENSLLNIRGADMIVSTVVNGFGRVLEALAHVVNRIKILILDFNQANSLSGSVFVHGGHTGDRIADVTGFLYSHCMLILGHRKDTESSRSIFSGCYCDNPW